MTIVCLVKYGMLNLIILDVRNVTRYYVRSLNQKGMLKLSQGIRLCGIDPAKMRDAFGLVVIDIVDNSINVVAAKQWFRTEYLKVESDIRDIVDKLQIQKVFLETNNTGTHVLEVLKKYTVPVYPISTVSKITDVKKIQSGKVMSKADIVAYTLILLQENRLIFPTPKSHDMQELINQFGVFQESITPSGLPSYSGPSNTHDDLVMALLIAIHGSRRWLDKGKLTMSLGPLPYGYTQK